MEKRMVPYVVSIDRELGEDEMAVPLVPSMMIAWDDPTLWTAVILVVLHPLYWLLVTHCERRTRALTRVCRDNYCACFFFALSTLSFSVYKIISFRAAVQNQIQCWFLRHNGILWCGHLLFIFGAICVIFSYRSLGFFTAFYGDYFGLLLPARVRSFPYTLMNHPIYMGGFMMFLGYALIFASQVGIFLSILIFIMYHIAIFFESSFTDRIYEAVERKYGPYIAYDGDPLVEDEYIEYQVEPRNGTQSGYLMESRPLSSSADGSEAGTETVTVIKRKVKPRTVTGVESRIGHAPQSRVQVSKTRVEHIRGPVIEHHFKSEVKHTQPDIELADPHVEYTSGAVSVEHHEKNYKHVEHPVHLTETHIRQDSETSDKLKAEAAGEQSVEVSNTELSSNANEDIVTYEEYVEYERELVEEDGCENS